MTLQNRRKATLVLGLVVALLLVPSPAGVRAGGGRWEWQNPLLGPEPLYGVWGSSAGDVFVVGGNWDWGTIVHYDGASWSAMDGGRISYLYGVWGSSGRDVFATGWYGYILHYVGNEIVGFVHLLVMGKQGRDRGG